MDAVEGAIAMRVGTRASRRSAFLAMAMPPRPSPPRIMPALAAPSGRDLAHQPGAIMKQVQARGAR